MGFVTVVLVCTSISYARTLALLPGSERVPLGKLWAWATKRMGRPAAAMALAVLPLTVWAVAQPEGSFSESPRLCLQRAWKFFRLANLVWGTAWLVAGMTGYLLGERDSVLASIVILGVVSVLVFMSTTANARGRMHEFLGNMGSSDRANNAAVVAAVVSELRGEEQRGLVIDRRRCVARTQVGGISAKEAFERAQTHFRGILFSELGFDDFAHSDLAGKEVRDADLRGRTQKLKLGQVDVFLSHSWVRLPASSNQPPFLLTHSPRPRPSPVHMWRRGAQHDPVHPKWMVLDAWAARFARKENRSPFLWLDKALQHVETLSSLPLPLLVDTIQP